MLMQAGDSALLIVDLQSRLMAAVHEADRVIANATVLMKAAGRLEVPTLVSEQYPQGIGHSVEPVAALMPREGAFEKTAFSCMQDAGFAERAKKLGRRQMIVAGAEAHVCVLQTALDLKAAGRQVFVVEDATGSRKPHSHAAAMARLRQAGAVIVTTEMVVFEWLGRAGTPVFKELSKLIK